MFTALDINCISLYTFSTQARKSGGGSGGCTRWGCDPHVSCVQLFAVRFHLVDSLLSLLCDVFSIVLCFVFVDCVVRSVLDFVLVSCC